ncbi:hypothetical protein AB1Y20_011091 [Prymnesium parvum]|uniref:Uncharacterized protein n=1 Tax=Prymnesium parvum TaxID=97485 RepID=A0AB34ILK5_PRYPA
MVGRVVLLSGHTPDPVRQDYDYRAQATDAFDRCIRAARERGVDRLRPNATVVPRLPEAAAAVRGGWKKLVAIHLAANGSSHDDVVVWHDADTVPVRRGDVVARAMRIAREQPSSAVWMQPGAQLVAATPGKAWSSFAGVPLSRVAKHLTTSNSIQSGVILVRASHAAKVFGSALIYYDARAEAAGRLVHHLARLDICSEFSALLGLQLHHKESEKMPRTLL